MPSPELALDAADTAGAASADELPPALSSMWRLCRLGYRYEPALMGTAFALTLVAAVPDALMALWLKLLGEGLLGHDADLLWVAVSGLAASAVATWFLQTVSTRLQRRFRDKVTIALESHVAGLQAGIGTVAHQERPEYLDRLSVLREQVFMLDHMYMSVFSTIGWIVRLAITVTLLATVNPVLIALVVFALPTVVTTSWRPGVERTAQERGAPSERLAGHLYRLITTSASAKELRVLGVGRPLADRRRSAFEQWYGPVAKARTRSATWYAAGWLVFGLAYVGGVVLVSTGAHASAASAILVLSAGSRLSGYVGATVGEVGFLRGIWLDGARRLAWLEDYAAREAEQADQPAPTRLRQGIRFEHVTFRYPGTTTPALEDVDLDLPAGSTVAIVGENGAGKSTLVKLVAKLYSPSEGRILVDGEDLARIDSTQWRSGLSGSFQDFFRFELLAGESVGVGDLGLLHDEPAVLAASERGGARPLLDRLPDGIETQLGSTWPQGVDLSFGEWQKVALSRGFMRSAPLVVALDEPTAALDAETEHTLFERYAAHAKERASDGTLTILVSHRFSTVRMADLIVVLSGARVAEFGSHSELMALGGVYAELYSLQARSYR